MKETKEKLLIAKLFTELMLICDINNCYGLDLIINPPFGGRAKCHFEFEVELPEDENDN